MAITTRGTLKTRVQQRLDRDDTTFNNLVEDWTAEIIREIENEYPFPYLAGTTTQSLTAGVAEYSLPAALIPHHEFSLRYETDTTDTYRELVSMDWEEFHRSFSAPEYEGSPKYYIIMGTSADENKKIRFYPVPNKANDVVYFGYYYTDTSSWTDSSANWLVENKPFILVEGISALAFEHYGEPEKADRARGLFEQMLREHTVEAKKQELKNRNPRVRMIYDEPKGKLKRFYGV